MSPKEATAEIFITALRAMPKAERDAVLVKMSKDKKIARDLKDLLIFAERENEPKRPFREYLASRRGQ